MPDGSLKKSGTESKEISGTLCCAKDGSADNMRIETHTHNFIGGLLGLNSRALLIATYTLNHGTTRQKGCNAPTGDFAGLTSFWSSGKITSHRRLIMKRFSRTPAILAISAAALF